MLRYPSFKWLSSGGLPTQVHWWTLGGQLDESLVVAAYQPKGANSLADSYINLANPGIYDATLGIAPTWDNVNGWKFNGVDQYLNTGIFPYSTYSYFIRFSTMLTPNQDRQLFGAIRTSSWNHVGMSPNSNGGGNSRIYVNGGSQSNGFGNTPQLASGNMGMSGNVAYKNGVKDGDFSNPTWVGVNPMPLALFVGCINLNNGTPYAFDQGYVQALWIANITLTPSQALLLSQMMGAL